MHVIAAGPRLDSDIAHPSPFLKGHLPKTANFPPLFRLGIRTNSGLEAAGGGVIFQSCPLRCALGGPSGC